MIALAVNFASIVVGGILGLMIRNSLKRNVTDAIMIGIGLFTVYVGVTSFSTGVSALVYLLAIVFGGIAGTALHLDELIGRLAGKVMKRLSKGGEENRFAAGFTGFFILSAVGAIPIVASFNVARGDFTLMYTKSVMDLVAGATMAASLGIGVPFAVIPILLVECLLAAFSAVLSPLLSSYVLEAFTCTGAILTVACGLNLAGATRIKLENYLPALLAAPLLAMLAERLGI